MVGDGPDPPPDPPSPPGGCLILYTFDGTEYVEEGLLDIHNTEGVDIIAHHTLTVHPEIKENSVTLRLTEHEQKHSNIDHVKLIAVLENGMKISLPLIYANHSSLGNVRSHLKFSDDRKTSIIGSYLNNGICESIELKFYYRIILKIRTVVKFLFIIEGNNPIGKL